MIYKKNQIIKDFPNSNFEFIKDELLKKIINAVNGRFIGGVVRDGLLGIITNDIDISTALLPQEVMNILTNMKFNPIPTGIAYGTVSLFLKKYKVEITSLRKDVETYGRRAEVSFNGSWEDDSIRRDFTFNALYLEPIYENNINYNIYDYHKGLEDLKNSKIKFIGNYKLRIKEDYLRIMRFVRFFLRYGINQINTYKEEINFLREFVASMELLSIERIIMEINSILKIHTYNLGIEIINELGISKLFFKDNLYILNVHENLLLEDKFLILFHRIPINIIKKLPLEKSIRIFLEKFQKVQWNIESLGKIWYETKNINLIKHMIRIYNILNNNKEFNFINNISDESFNLYKQSHKFIYNTGVERGKEEIELRIKFLNINKYQM